MSERDSNRRSNEPYTWQTYLEHEPRRKHEHGGSEEAHSHQPIRDSKEKRTKIHKLSAHHTKKKWRAIYK